MSDTPDRLLHQGEFLKINVPDMFADPEFVKFLNDPGNNIATWHHTATDPEPHEYSDCFVTYDNGEGSHSNMPERWWNLICDLVKQEMGTEPVYLILHLTNLEVPAPSFWRAKPSVKWIYTTVGWLKKASGDQTTTLQIAYEMQDCALIHSPTEGDDIEADAEYVRDNMDRDEIEKMLRDAGCYTSDGHGWRVRK